MDEPRSLPGILNEYGSELFEVMKLSEASEPVDRRRGKWRGLSPWRGERVRGNRVVVGRRGLSAVGATAAGAAIAVGLLLSAGAAPSVAKAFPILARPAVDLSHRAAVERGLVARGMSPKVAAASLRNAHEFTSAAGTGFTFETSDGSDICLVTYPPQGFLEGQPDAHNAGCSPTTVAEARGMISAAAWGNGSGQLQTYEALVPAGGTFVVTTNGTSSAVPVPADGIVAGVVQQGATVSVAITVNGTTTTQEISQP